MTTSGISFDTTRILRHIVATIAFRASRSLREAPASLENVRLADGGMTARELLNHMTNVMAFALATVTGTERLRHDPSQWQQEIDRFYSILAQVDAKLAEGAVVDPGMDLRLVQGPLADALTHVGQLHAMRRLAGGPVPPTNYIKADVQIGRIALKDQVE
jgi:uncharacterized damage-inducible protein DinB